jgi:excisionase family DNA binding protein
MKTTMISTGARRRPIRDVIEPDASDRAAFERLFEALKQPPGETRPQLVDPDGAPIPLPESLFSALRDAVGILRTGAAVSISPLHRRLTTTEAGELLGVSRQFLTRLIDRGELSCERTGKHRRIILRDLLEYRDRRDRNRIDALDAMTAQAGAEGEYD